MDVLLFASLVSPLGMVWNDRTGPEVLADVSRLSSLEQSGVYSSIRHLSALNVRIQKERFCFRVPLASQIKYDIDYKSEEHSHT